MPSKKMKVHPLRLFSIKNRLYAYELAYILGCSHNHLTKIMRYNHIPRYDLQIKIDKLLKGETNFYELLKSYSRPTKKTRQ